MADSFDAYHKWLGIPPKDQPPNHYRLLGIELFESDADVIEGAADQRMSHVRTFQTGQNSALSQRILNELSAAKLCLLNPAKRAEYDYSLRAKIAAAQPPAPLHPTITPSSPVLVLPTARPLAQPSPMPPLAEDLSLAIRRSDARRRAAWKLPAAVALLATVLLVTAAAVATLLRSKLPAPSADSHPPQVAVRSAAGPTHPPQADGSEDSVHDSSFKNKRAPEKVPQPPAEQPAGPPRAAQALDWFEKLGATIERAAGQGDQGVTKIVLSRSKVLDSDLALLRAFPDLLSLALDGTAITDVGLREIEPLSRLESLNLRDTKITSAGLQSLEKHSRLNWLDLANVGSVGDAGLAHLRGLVELRVLNLGAAQLTGTGLKHLRPLVNLEWLCLDYNRLTDESLADVAALPALKTLILHDTPITDAALERLQGVRQLEKIDLRGTGVTVAGVQSLKLALPALSVELTQQMAAALEMPATNASRPDGVAPPTPAPADDLLARIRKLGGAARQNMELPEKTLTAVRINNDKATDDDLDFLKSLTSLTLLELHSEQVTDKTLTWIEPLTSLTSLTLDRAKITDAGLGSLAGLNSLVTLNITEAPLTDAALKHLKGLSELESLDFSQTQITGAGLTQLRAPRLKTIVLDGTKLNDKSIASLVRFSGLRSISLRDTKVGDKGLLRLKRLKSLADVNVSGTKVSPSGIQQFREGSSVQVLGGGAVNGVAAARPVPGAANFGIAGQAAPLMEITPRMQQAAAELKQLGGRFTNANAGRPDLSQGIMLQGPDTTDAALALAKELPYLRTVNLWNCPNVTDAGMKDLAQLRSLRELTLLKAKVTDEGLNHLTALTNLTSLHLLELGITTTEPLTAFRQLHTLRIWNIPLPAEGLAPIGRLRALTELELNGPKGDDTAFSFLAELRGLTKLTLNGLGLTDATLAYVGKLSELRTLVVGLPVTDRGLAHLKRLKGLSELRLTNCAITNAGMAMIGEHAALRQLEIKSSAVDDDGLKPLEPLSQIDSLNLAHTNVGNAGLRHLKSMVRLNLLELSGTRLTDDGIKELWRFAALKRLHLGNTEITDQGLSRLEGVPSLESLSLDHTKVTDRGLGELARLPNLRWVNLSNTQVTDAGVAALRQARPMLNVSR